MQDEVFIELKLRDTKSNNTGPGGSLGIMLTYTVNALSSFSWHSFPEQCKVSATIGKIKDNQNPKTAVVHRESGCDKHPLPSLYLLVKRWWEIKETWLEKSELQRCGCNIYFVRIFFFLFSSCLYRRKKILGEAGVWLLECVNSQEKWCAYNSFLSPAVADGVFYIWVMLLKTQTKDWGDFVCWTVKPLSCGMLPPWLCDDLWWRGHLKFSIVIMFSFLN